MELVQVLGNIEIPPEMFSTIYNRDYGKRFRLISSLPGWDYRDPTGNLGLIAGDAQTWHQDNNGGSAGLIVWTNIYPTEIRLPDGRIVSANNNDVVLIDNKRVRHRTPPAYLNRVRRHRFSISDRHFLRNWTDGYPSDDEIERWKREIAVLKGDIEGRRV